MASKPIEYASGGQGVLDSPPSRSDLVLQRSAVRGGYNLTPEQRALIVARACEILEAPPEILEDKDGNTYGVSYRDQLGAAKVLLAADKMDLDVERLAITRAQGPGGDKHLHLNAPAEMFRELMNEVRTHQHPAEADSEPAGDD